MYDSAQRGIAVGFFDGVHLGHQRILSSARIALTFKNHPLSILRPELAPRLIMPFEERRRLILSQGVEKVVALEFTRELAAMSAEDFVEKFIAPCQEKKIVCGANWKFGHGGQGNQALLEKLGFQVEIAPFATWKDQRISSTRIRKAIEKGEFCEASAMLSRPWKIFGRVVPGKGLGRKIGFPTVNIKPENLFLNLPHGVYAVKVNGSRAVANFGLAPTLGEMAWKNEVLEIHFLDEPNETFGEVEIHLFIRPEKKFGSLEELVNQISSDCAAARGFFSSEISR
ncbi:MAG: riboflavin biosynthesis protein RibF [Kiritimatiellae bacterium]|nr:riboflavin biosynthesis protein RibF [Kiritimatiellia bacterium]